MRQAALKCESKSADAKAYENEAVRGPGKEKSREIELDSKGETDFCKKKGPESCLTEFEC